MRFLLIPCMLALAPCNRLVAELLVSDTFDTSLAGWSLSTDPGFDAGTAVWSSLDSGGLSTSGSLELTGSGSLVVQRCVPVTDPILNWVASAKVNVPHVESALEASLNIYFLESSDCSGGADVGAIIFFPALTDGVWTPTITSDSGPTFGNIPNIHSVLVQLQTDNNFKGTVYLDDVLVGTNVAATFAGTRFSAGVAWKTSTGQIGLGSPVDLTSESAYFSFFVASNVELILKVLDGCNLNKAYWVFAAGLTNVATLMSVDDNQGLRGRIYTTPQGHPFFPIEDTSALATCP